MFSRSVVLSAETVVVSIAFMDMDIQAIIWRGMAQEAAAAAAQMDDPELRLSMLSIAAGYEAMAKHADAMARARETPSASSERV